MIVKQEWTDRDFELMGWHDSCIHSISFPVDKNEFILDIELFLRICGYYPRSDRQK